MNDFSNQTVAGGTPSPESYQQMCADQRISRGSTRAVALPQALPGFEVGRSTLEGAPIGWDPKGVASQITIDPDVAGGGFTVDMSKVSADQFSQATERAGLRQAVSIDELRDRAASVYQSFVVGNTQAAAQEEVMRNENMMGALDIPAARPTSPSGHPPAGPPPQMGVNPHATEVKAASFAAPAPVPAPEPAAPPAQAPQALGLFEQMAPKAAAPQPQARVATAAASPGGSAAPGYKVTFEIQGAPMVLEAWYHDIVRNAHTLVLVYDTGCVGYPRSRLQKTDSDIAVHVAGSDSIYLVQDPQITFEFEGQEFHILLIKGEHPYGETPAPVPV